ncbi:MAG TPA: sugar phosphate isomerase/epimerase [Chthonomonadaceae bacterium]|nr:sugar phosphate isomerase/epimerase [Chthonomonadaceae bacterium]
MRFERDSHSLSRRAFLRSAALGAASLLLLPKRAFAQQSQGAPLYARFRMGVQSYTLRNFNVDDALAKTQTLGLRWWEGFPGHFPVSDDPKVIAGYQDKLKAHNIRMPSYGVVDFTNDEADARRKLAFARDMRIRTLTANPTPDSLSLLDRLAQEYRVRIGIVNQPSDSPHFNDWQQMLSTIKNYSPRIGMCVDTGSYLRSDQSPVNAAEQSGSRLYGLHLVNLKNGSDGKTKEFAEIGESGGLLDTIGLFKALDRIHYRGVVALEFEANADNPEPFLQHDIQALHHLLSGTP